MSDETRRPVWRRALAWFGGLALLLAALALLGYALDRRRAGGRLGAVLAELDASDPDRRIEALLGSRPEIPDAENSADRVGKLALALPSLWPDAKVMKKFATLEPNATLSPASREELDALLAPAASLREGARDLVRFPRGRFPTALPDGLRGNPMDGLSFKVLSAAQLLELDGWDRALAGKPDDALASARTALNVGRSMQDDPNLLPHVVRMGAQLSALRTAQRAMALGEPSDAALAEFGRDLVPEESSEGLAFAYRVERAIMHTVMQQVASGEIPAAELEGLLKSRLPVVPEWVGTQVQREVARREHPDVVRLLTRAVEAARLTGEEALRAEEALEQERKAGGDFVRATFLNAVKFGRQAREARARVAAMRALIAVERFRRKTGKWPASLEDVVPAFLDAEPEDPIDGKRIRYLMRADGVVAYSVGADRADDGGDLNGDKDLGFRLWDVDKRRVPPGKP